MSFDVNQTATGHKKGDIEVVLQWYIRIVDIIPLSLWIARSWTQKDRDLEQNVSLSMFCSRSLYLSKSKTPKTADLTISLDNSIRIFDVTGETYQIFHYDTQKEIESEQKKWFRFPSTSC